MVRQQPMSALKLISRNSLQNPAAPHQRFSAALKIRHTFPHVMAMAVRYFYWRRESYHRTPGLKTVLLRL